MINSSLHRSPRTCELSIAIMPSPAVAALKVLFPVEQLALAGTDEYDKLNSS